MIEIGNDPLDRIAQDGEVSCPTGQRFVKAKREVTLQQLYVGQLFRRPSLQLGHERLGVDATEDNTSRRVILPENSVQRGSGRFGDVIKDDRIAVQRERLGGRMPAY